MRNIFLLYYTKEIDDLLEKLNLLQKRIPYTKDYCYDKYYIAFPESNGSSFVPKNQIPHVFNPRYTLYLITSEQIIEYNLYKELFEVSFHSYFNSHKDSYKVIRKGITL